MRVCIIGVAVLLIAAPAWADSIGPGGTWNAADGSFGVLKTPPMSNSQMFTVPISYHSTVAYSNWAGVIMDLNIDPNPTEAHFQGAAGVPPDPTRPGTFPTVGGMPLPVPTVTFWSTQWFNSGANNGPASQPFPIGALVFHASNTDPINNSDVDITFSAWNIWHVTSAEQSQVVEVPASIWLYVRPGETWGQPVEPGQGYWVHNETPFTAHVVASLFWATNAFIGGQGGIGVEHIPEPASVALVLAGLGTAVLARRRGARV